MHPTSAGTHPRVTHVTRISAGMTTKQRGTGTECRKRRPFARHIRRPSASGRASARPLIIHSGSLPGGCDARRPIKSRLSPAAGLDKRLRPRRASPSEKTDARTKPSSPPSRVPINRPALTPCAFEPPPLRYLIPRDNRALSRAVNYKRRRA